MVARNTDADLAQRPVAHGPVQRFFRWWQVWLTLVLRGVGNSLRANNSLATANVLEPLRSPMTVWAGCLALLAGAVFTVVAAPSGIAKRAALLAAVAGLLWGALRLALMHVGATGTLSSDRPAIRGAWGLGSTVWLLGITPELRVLSWALSGAVTWVALERLGASRRQAGRCVGVAWGVQALVTVGSWLARNAIIGILAGRS